MFKLKELFRINYKNKNIIILLDNQNRKVFLEEKEDGSLICPPIKIFIELYKIYNIKDEILYEIKKEKPIKKKKTIKQHVLEFIKIYAIAIPIALSSVKIVDKVMPEIYTYSQQYEKLNELYPKKVTKEDVIEVINNNPNLTEEYKKIAKDQLEEFLIIDPEMNLKIYYENMKDIVIEDNVPLQMVKFQAIGNVVGYYNPTTNKIVLAEDANEEVKHHEFAHTGHNIVLFRRGKNIIVRDLRGDALAEAMNNKMIGVTYPDTYSYHNEAYLLDFFMENVDNYNVHSYTEYGIQALIDELKEKYPEVDIDYLIELIDARDKTSIKLGIQIDYIEEKQFLDELFKITLSNIDKEDYFSSFATFAKLIESFGADNGKENEAKKLKKQYLKEYLNNIYKTKYSLQDKTIYDLNCIIYKNNNFYIGCDDFYLDYSGKTVNCSSNDCKIKLRGPLEHYYLDCLKEGKKIHLSENIKEILYRTQIISLGKAKTNEQLTDKEIVEVLNTLYDYYIDKDAKTYHDLISSYRGTISDETYQIEKALLKQNRNLEDILKKENIDYNIKLQETAKELNILTEENKIEEIASDINCVIEIDGYYYPCSYYSLYSAGINNPTIPHYYSDKSEKFTIILDNAPLTFHSYDENYNLEYHSVYNKVINIYSTYIPMMYNEKKEHLDQESIKELLYENDLLGKENYENAFKLKDGTFITDKSLDNSFYIEFGVTKDGNITYRIKEEEKVIYEPEKGAEYKAQISYKDFLDGMDMNILDNIEENLEESRLKKSLVNFKNYFDNIDVKYQKTSEDVIEKSLSGHSLEETPTITFKECKKIILDGKEYNLKDILIDYNKRNDRLTIFFPDGTSYPINLWTKRGGMKYSHHLDYYIEKYQLPTNKTYEISLENLINIVRKDFEKEVEDHNSLQIDQFNPKKIK